MTTVRTHPWWQLMMDTWNSLGLAPGPLSWAPSTRTFLSMAWMEAWEAASPCLQMTCSWEEQAQPHKENSNLPASACNNGQTREISSRQKWQSPALGRKQNPSPEARGYWSYRDAGSYMKGFMCKGSSGSVECCKGLETTSMSTSRGWVKSLGRSTQWKAKGWYKEWGRELHTDKASSQRQMVK